MHRKTLLYSCCIGVLISAFFAGCSKGPNEEELKRAELTTQLTAIQQSYGELEQVRADLAAAEASLAELEAVPERTRTDEQKAELEALPARITELEAQREVIFDTVQNSLAEFLNVALNEFPQAPETLEGLRIYSNESILVAWDMVAKAGDYKKAVDHLAAAKSYYEMAGISEVHQPLVDTLAELESWRWITQERFDAVKNGMTRDEVKAMAGVPYFGNIQTDDARDVETWLYRKSEGGAAAFYFKMKSGKVYGKKWDAIQTKVVS